MTKDILIGFGLILIVAFFWGVFCAYLGTGPVFSGLSGILLGYLVMGWWLYKRGL